MEGVGCLDAEGCERAWANLNQASGSTSEKGLGARIDSLNHCMNDWNWRKTTTMVTHVIKHFPEAVKMATELKELWLIINDLVSGKIIASWEAMSTDPKIVKGTWTSIFLMSKTGGGSRLKKVLREELVRNADQKSAKLGLTAPTWLSEGLDIEKLQIRLREDVKRSGKEPTGKQLVELTNHRTSLSSRITTHRTHASHFIDIQLMSSGQTLSEEMDSQPELADLHLPSHIFTTITKNECSLHVIRMEEDLRKAECYETLRRVRMGSLQHAEMIHGKHQNAHGEVANTHTQTAITCIATCVRQAHQDYNHSFHALLGLDIKRKALLPLQELRSTDFKNLHSMLTGSREIPQGHLRLPWFWQVRERIPGQPEITDQEEYIECESLPPRFIPSDRRVIQ
ncbi:hypothetical protein RSAG8_10333, partial [Rhizoctonia solani AG-8 WAC10335]